MGSRYSFKCLPLKAKYHKAKTLTGGDSALADLIFQKQIDLVFAEVAVSAWLVCVSVFW